MNDKENAGELSAEQRARISQHFKAAKALIERRKRQRCDAIDHRQLSSYNDVAISDLPKRLPLSKISTNVLSPVRLQNCNLPKKNCNQQKNLVQHEVVSDPRPQVKCNRMPFLGDSSDVEVQPNDEAFGDENGGLLLEYDPFVNSCSNLLSQQNVSNVFNTNSSDNLLEPHIVADLNDDFDESILEQIDVLCGQKLSGNSERDENASDTTDNENIIQKEDDVIIRNVDVYDRVLKSEEISNSPADQVCVVGESGEEEDESGKNMPEEYAKYIKSLNDRQQEAACSDISTPLMIVAGPGSGKTSTMVGRVLMLLSEGIKPSNILAMTFTTAAAAEMRERIGAVAGKKASKEITISTFHSFSLQLCRLHAEKLGRTPEFLIYGQGQQRKAVIEAVRLLEDGKKEANHGLCKLTDLCDVNSPKHFKDKSKKWIKFVTQGKAAGKTPEDFSVMGDEIGAAIFRNYNTILKSCNALDYHDFISCSVKLLTDFPKVFQECQESWKAIVVDEFQDTSAMQYGLLRILASHQRITIVGDEDQSIFSFNGADVSGFDSFRRDFPTYKEVRLNKNYRFTRCIVEAASFLIRNNSKRCSSKDVLTDNSSGAKITIKECCNEEAQCAFVVDKILEITSSISSAKLSFGSIAVLYRRQVTGKIFQTAFRNRKIPFNVHGVAFYRKKVVRAIISMLSTTLPGCVDGQFRRVFKALLLFEKEEKKRVIEHIEKVSTVRKCSFISSARDIFSAKISGTLKRCQLTQGRKVLLTLEMISKLVQREQSISAVITSVANMIPQKYLLEQRAVVDVDGGKLLNEDNDIRSVLQYLLDDVSVFLTTIHNFVESANDVIMGKKGCMAALKSFIDYTTERERENFQSRKHDNEDSVTLTTIHQSKGLEWDTVFIVKANEAEIPLLHEYNGILNENATSIEEERRLLYVAMTRARKKLFMLYIIMDSNWQVLQPSRFLREIPHHLLENENETLSTRSETNHLQTKQATTPQVLVSLKAESPQNITMPQHESSENQSDKELTEEHGDLESCHNSNFLKRFSAEDRAVISLLFHQWAKKRAFQEPKRLLSKVSFVIDERLRAKKSSHKDALRELKSCLTSDEAYQFAVSVLKWEQIPSEKRAYLMREKQEHFQKLRIESAMGSSEPTAKQIAYLQSLGCTTVPTSRLHASRLIEEYKAL